jgi:hypothetical protein
LYNYQGLARLTVPWFSAGLREGEIGHLVFGTPAENFCKCFCKKKLAAKKREIENEQKCTGFERVLNKSVQVLRRSEHFLSENYRGNLGCQRMD